MEDKMGIWEAMEEVFGWIQYDDNNATTIGIDYCTHIVVNNFNKDEA